MKLITSVLFHAALLDLWVKIRFHCCPFHAAVHSSSPQMQQSLFVLSLFISLCLVSLLTAAGSAEPKLCPAGTFSSLPGRRMLSECQPCPSGFYCRGPGLSAPTGECWEGEGVHWLLCTLCTRAACSFLALELSYGWKLGNSLPGFLLLTRE